LELSEEKKLAICAFVAHYIKKENIYLVIVRYSDMSCTFEDITHLKQDLSINIRIRRPAPQAVWRGWAPIGVRVPTVDGPKVDDL
jgi:hypothetical protein